MAENAQAVGAIVDVTEHDINTTLSWMPMPSSMLMTARKHRKWHNGLLGCICCQS
jgi:hypothetical protein